MLYAFEQELRDEPKIAACLAMKGAFDFVMRVVASRIEDYEGFLKPALLHLPDIHRELQLRAEDRQDHDRPANLA